MPLSLSPTDLRAARATMHAMEAVAGGALVAGRGPRWIEHVVNARSLGAASSRVQDLVGGTDPTVVAGNGWAAKLQDYAAGSAHHAAAGAGRLAGNLHSALDGYADLQGSLARLLDRSRPVNLERGILELETGAKRADPGLLGRMSGALDGEAAASITRARDDAHEAWYRINMLGGFDGS